MKLQVLGDCISLYNPTCATRVHTCHSPRDIQQICCNTQTGAALALQCSCCSCLGTATYIYTLSPPPSPYNQEFCTVFTIQFHPFNRGSHGEQSTCIISPTYILQIPLLSPSLPMHTIRSSTGYSGDYRQDVQRILERRTWTCELVWSVLPIPLQWPFNVDTGWTEESVHISEVLYLGIQELSILERCPHFKGVLREVSSFQGCSY